jgi:hypothetical protein
MDYSDRTTLDDILDGKETVGHILQAAESHRHKPVHGGYPGGDRIMIMGTGGTIIRDDFGDAEPISVGPVNPVPGSGWTDERTQTDQAIAAELVASESPRANGFNYGTGWGKAPKPPIYFDAVRLSIALDQISHDASARAWRLTTALRAVRLAETPTEKADAVALLSETYSNLMAEVPDAKVAMLVNDLANVVDQIAPPNPKGYVPHMGIHYAVKPLRDIVAKLRTYFASVGG